VYFEKDPQGTAANILTIPFITLIAITAISRTTLCDTVLGRAGLAIARLITIVTTMAAIRFATALMNAMTQPLPKLTALETPNGSASDGGGKKWLLTDARTTMQTAADRHHSRVMHAAPNAACGKRARNRRGRGASALTSGRVRMPPCAWTPMDGTPTTVEGQRQPLRAGARFDGSPLETIGVKGDWYGDPYDLRDELERAFTIVMQKEGKAQVTDEVTTGEFTPIHIVYRFGVGITYKQDVWPTLANLEQMMKMTGREPAARTGPASGWSSRALMVDSVMRMRGTMNPC
jgi:hypothetical protein